jgi:hypothetical protein
MIFTLESLLGLMLKRCSTMECLLRCKCKRDDGSESFIRSLFEYESQNPENVAGIVETKTFRYTDAATKYIGKSTIPKVRGAFTLSTKYKAFSLSTQFCIV